MCNLFQHTCICLVKVLESEVLEIMSTMLIYLYYRPEELPAPTESTDTNPPYEDTEPHTTQRSAVHGSFGSQLLSVIVFSRI